MAEAALAYRENKIYGTSSLSTWAYPLPPAIASSGTPKYNNLHTPSGVVYRLYPHSLARLGPGVVLCVRTSRLSCCCCSRHRTTVHCLLLRSVGLPGVHSKRGMVEREKSSGSPPPPLSDALSSAAHTKPTRIEPPWFLLVHAAFWRYSWVQRGWLRPSPEPRLLYSRPHRDHQVNETEHMGTRS